MQQLTVYKITTYILLPFAALFGLFAIFMIFMGLANPMILLPGAMMACFCIYTIACMIFLVKGIGKQQPCNPSLKDWIKVNGYVAAALGGMSFFNSVGIIFSPKTEVLKFAQQALEAQSVNAQLLTVGQIATVMTGLSYVMLFFSIILLVQLSINFKLVKKYAYLFGGEPQ